MRFKRPAFWLGFTCLGLAASPVAAQRTAENALRSAEDAFGTTIGSENIGLYSPSDVRGFSPFAAGNVRLEGLYLDAVTGFNLRLVRGSNIRVGISAQGYPFPAPTGIADFRLRLPGEEAAASTVAETTSFGGLRAEIDTQLPVIPAKLSIGAGAHISRDPALYGDSAIHGGAALIARWRPASNLEITPFWSGFIHRSEDTQPRFIVAGPYLPPKVRRGTKLAQPWALYSADDINYGTIARWSDEGLSLSAGLFRSLTETRQSFSDQFLGVSRDGLASDHLVVKSPGQKFASTSGEARASRAFADGPRHHIFHLSARGRKQGRRYGGSGGVSLGPSSIEAPDRVLKPEFTLGPQSRDEIRQASLGLGYEGRWTGVGELTLGIQRTGYRKSSHTPTSEETLLKASPWLFNAAAAAHLSPGFAIYGGFTRGLEESPVAPDVAVNRDEAPPAILTRQYDAGVRWAFAPGSRLVAGVFNIEKPYFNLDSAQLYRRLGEVRHRGAEISITSALTSNLDIVAGAVLLDARVTGGSEAAGLVGKRPVGATGRTLLFTAEYRPPQVAGLSFDFGVHSFGRRVANTANSLDVPAATLVNLGARYRWTVGKVPATIRLQINNMFDAYVWEVRASNAFFYNTPRHVMLRLTTDL